MACRGLAAGGLRLLCDNINYNWVNRDGGYEAELVLHIDPAAEIAPAGLAPKARRIRG